MYRKKPDGPRARLSSLTATWPQPIHSCFKQGNRKASPIAASPCGGEIMTTYKGLLKNPSIDFLVTLPQYPVNYLYSQKLFCSFHLLGHPEKSCRLSGILCHLWKKICLTSLLNSVHLISPLLLHSIHILSCLLSETCSKFFTSIHAVENVSLCLKRDVPAVGPLMQWQACSGTFLWSKFTVSWWFVC